MSKSNKIIGKKGLVQYGDLQFEVRILEHKPSYGRKDRYLVEPVSGFGQKVVELKNIKLSD